MKHPYHLVFRGPKARVRFHALMSYVWLLSMVVVPFFPAFHGLSNLAALLIMEVSLYSNFATEFGSIDAAKSSEQTQKGEV